MRGARWVLGIGALALAVGFGPRASAQVFAYPEDGQSTEQQDQDQSDCHTWAVKTTGVDPTKPAQVHRPEHESALGGLVRGPALSAGLAVATHSPWGAIAHVILKRREVEARYEQQQQEIDRHYRALSQYDRAFAACLEGRGYSVR